MSLLVFSLLTTLPLALPYPTNTHHPPSHALLRHNAAPKVLDMHNPQDILFFQQNIDGKLPAIVRNALHFNHEQWTDRLMSINGKSLIEYDVRYSKTGEIESFECSLNEFIGGVFDGSDHEESMYLMNEDILNDREANGWLLDQLALPEAIFGEDLFAHFPEQIRPKLALIIGGVGARSFLHGDPYEWMGWNYLLEGEKLCMLNISMYTGLTSQAYYLPLGTFIPPSLPDELFQARRNAPEAWGEEYDISAGWVSDDIDLYRTILPGPPSNKSSKGLNAMFRGRAPLASGGHGPLPVFVSGSSEVDSCDLRLVGGALQLVQREGDLVMIPPRWWHQVYHLQPSVAVAGQYVSRRTLRGMQEHMLRWCKGGDHGVDFDEWDKLAVQEQVRATIRKALELKHGAAAGGQMANDLLQ